MPRPRINRPKEIAEPASPESKLHPRNKHQGRYDFDRLIATNGLLRPFVSVNEHGIETIDFFNPEAVKELNRSLLMHHYRVSSWEIPENYLVPPVPGRADYLHYAADLMSGNYPKQTTDEIPRGTQVRCLDIGVGANCIYPILGKKEYGWAFVGSDIDAVALTSAQHIVDANGLEASIELRKQQNQNWMLKGIVRENEKFDLCICNPPFHASEAEAKAASSRKVRNLTQTADAPIIQNFGGGSTELWYEGGEIGFLKNFIEDSKHFETQVLWFTILVSKHENVGKARRILEDLKALNVQVIDMAQGMKRSRIIGWTFKNRKARKNWHKANWQFD